MNVDVFPQSDLVEEYFEAHSSSKVLTSDRTLQKLQTPKLDRVSDLAAAEDYEICARSNAGVRLFCRKLCSAF